MRKKGEKMAQAALSLKEQKNLLVDEIKKILAIFEENKKQPLKISIIHETLDVRVIEPSVLDEFMRALELKGLSWIEDDQSLDEDEVDNFLIEYNEAEEVEEKVDSKSNDPVRLYLKRMGSASLLTREGEVEIATRIEKGERKIVKAILMSPMGTYEIIQLGKRIEDRRTKPQEIFRGLEGEDITYTEEEYLGKIKELLLHVETYNKKMAEAFEVLKKDRKPSEKNKKYLELLKENNEELMSHFQKINFNRKVIDRIVIKFKNLVERLRELRRREKEAIKKTFFDASENGYELFVESVKNAENNEKALNELKAKTGLNWQKLKSYQDRKSVV